MKNIAIIGGGLGGLYAAQYLQNHNQIMLFEARERLGGRIHAIQGLDLGPSWIWLHQTRMLALIRSLGLEIFMQYDKGAALYETPHTVERFMPPASSPSARIQGGTVSIIEQLTKRLTATKVHLGETVISLQHRNDHVELISTKQKYEFDKVIVTLPPRLAVSSLSYEPPLPAELQTRFASTPTWMGNAAKCVIEFDTPFWREMGLSGFCFSHAGPMREIHDACTQDRYALFGFISANTHMDNIENLVRAQLKNLFGHHVSRMTGFHYVDWRTEKFTSVAADRIPLASHPQYGLEAAHFDGKLQFIGSETSYDDGGYLEGALASVERLYENHRGS